jgi:type I protein arginine methyltransferase
MYNTREYLVMIADIVRMGAYTEALRAAVKPGDVVVDIGTGTGIFALLACQYGASLVYAIDPNENIHVARRLAKENGFSERIEFIQSLSTEMRLHEKADVVISDLRGVLPLYQKHIPTLADARGRLLKPGGLLIPRRDTLHVCMVDAPELYRNHSGVCDVDSYDLNLNYAREVSVNVWSQGRASAEQMLTESNCWATLHYDERENPDVRGGVSQRVVRNGVAHGLILWFDTELMDGIGFSNAPGSEKPAKVYGSAFFPFLRPVPVSENDEAQIELQAVLVNDEYTWCWNTHIVSSHGVSKADFQQSTFYATIFSADGFRRRQPSYIPKLNSKRTVELFIQQEMDGVNSVATIAKKLLDHFPDQFCSLPEAIERVGDSSEKYGS